MEGSCYCLRTFQEGDLSGAANVNVVGCSRLAELVDGTDGLAYHASVPLYAPHGKKLGVLNVADTDWRELSAADLRLLYTIGDLLSIAVERGRLFERSTQIGAMEERNRLAREIHDTLGQNLAAITLHMETADALLEAGADTKEIWGIIQKALKLSRSGLQDARRSVLDLRAAPLEGRTLVEAVQALIDDFSLRNNADVELELAGTSRPLPTRIEVGAYRVIQEALANVEKHAQAKSVTIDLAITTRVLEITITDDGQGFQPEDIPEKRYGLVGMNERIYLMGGKLDLHSGPSVGTQLHITIPLQ
jgi:two-component system NarL family sensor kinase